MSLTTVDTDDVIVVLVINESTASGTLQTVSNVAASGLTFFRRGGVSFTRTVSGVKCNGEIWWAAAPVALTAKVITVTLTGVIDNASVIAFGVNGTYDYTHPWDTNVSVPSVTMGLIGFSAAPVFSTSQAHDFIILLGADFDNASQNFNSNWTALAQSLNGGGINYARLWSSYVTVAGTQSGASPSFAVPGPTNVLYIVDALAGDPAINAGVIVQTLLKPTQLGNLSSIDGASISQILARPTQTGVLSEKDAAVISQTLRPLTQAGVLAEKDTAIITQILGRVTQHATDTIQIGVIHQTLGRINQRAYLNGQPQIARAILDGMIISRVSHGLTKDHQP